MVFAFAPDSTITSGFATCCVLRSLRSGWCGDASRPVWSARRGQEAYRRRTVVRRSGRCQLRTFRRRQRVGVYPAPSCTCSRRILALSLDPKEILSDLSPYGEIGLILIIFAETGLLIGFFLPGDSLLFTAGLLANQGKLNLAAVLIGCFVAAVVGDQVGFTIRPEGWARGCFRRPDSRFFKQEYVDRTEDFFDQHGAEDHRARALRARGAHVRAGARRRRQDDAAGRSSASTSSARSSGCSA